MKALITILSIMLVAVLPSEARALSSEPSTVCEYCDLVVGECKDVSQFPGGGSTGYSECRVEGMTCYYSGQMCNDSFFFDEVGPDGVLRASAPHEPSDELIAKANRSMIERNGIELTLDCRRFVVAVKPTARIFLSMRSRTITL